eukprot:gnl/TRDRNA2_/TRDRNA2_126049_c1_seq1.p1 gnl/TRDRNA2_/TRDRNA2_126049_c1~~gnl/TRDRNA2_/TRDRNA2_126049_c1_seq1.p1  ORF type:complete len:280 (+),score=57.63 gnl/TRDRNA2_/TRDRNA2_126049_c1_seq1:2-841(+)
MRQSSEVRSARVRQEVLDRHVWDLCREHEHLLGLTQQRAVLSRVQTHDEIRAWRRRVRKLRHEGSSATTAPLSHLVQPPAVAEACDAVTACVAEALKKKQSIEALAGQYATLCAVLHEMELHVPPAATAAQQENTSLHLRRRLEAELSECRSNEARLRDQIAEQERQVQEARRRLRDLQCEAEKRSLPKKSEGEVAVESHLLVLQRANTVRSEKLERSAPDQGPVAQPNHSSELLQLRAELRALKARCRPRPRTAAAVAAWPEQVLQLESERSPVEQVM